VIWAAIQKSYGDVGGRYVVGGCYDHVGGRGGQVSELDDVTPYPKIICWSIVPGEIELRHDSHAVGWWQRGRVIRLRKARNTAPVAVSQTRAVVRWITFHIEGQIRLRTYKIEEKIC
jgi:hypothetical protein